MESTVGTGSAHIDPQLVAGCSPIEAVDLLERAAARGRRDAVDALYDAFGGRYPDGHPFAYESFALALALRYAREDVARDLLGRGVDLLAKPRLPRGMRAMLPPDDTFTRFGLTRHNPTLFLNPMDPTVSTEVFRDPHTHEQLAGAPYLPPRDLAASCDLVRGLAREGLFDATVYDDLFRAALTAAWHALRHGEKDEATAATCLALCDDLLALHRAHACKLGDRSPAGSSYGDARIFTLMEKMIVPRGDRRIALWVCERSPRVFLQALTRLDWLREDTPLVRDAAQAIVRAFSMGAGADGAPDGTPGGTPSSAPASDIACLLTTLAAAGELPLVKAVADFPQVDSTALDAALEAASAAGHADVSAWLLERISSSSRPGDDLQDLLL
ncbi:MAG: hypothetical protein UHI81_06590 [Olegusella sp.]|nr:hypothetical protein [Olegusella sp.]